MTETASVVVITGGSSGLGRATAMLFAAQGWRVGIIARGAAGLADVQAALEAAGARVCCAEADVADADALALAGEAVAAALGTPDVWINCAGNGVYGWFGEVPAAEFARVTDVTYMGTVNGTRVALALMGARGSGGIVNICSAVAFHGMPLMSSYAGAKAAVRGFTQAVRGELTMQRSRVRVTAVFPPAVNTPFFSHAVSHMAWPSRPARPVYQPDVIARGIYSAAMRGRPEAILTGTAWAFHLGVRAVPGVIGWCMSQLGMEKQVTRDADALALADPTLWGPSAVASGAAGPFGAGARRSSATLWLGRVLSARPRSGRFRPTPAGSLPDPAPAGLAAPAAVS